jgi:MEDS: MEthanogen/methylotroph, DcmR Sensory domain/PucR C-terminal helix-turn-helix domain/GGDEF-like domain
VNRPAGSGVSPGRESGLPGIALDDREHVCVFYRGPQERDAVLSAFFGAGYAEGDKCLCIADDHDPDAVAARLDPEHRRGPDQLTVLPATAYLTDGRFEPQRVYSQWHSIIGGYVDSGYRHVRGTGELSWFLRHHRAAGGDAGPLLEYEALCNQLVKRRPATIFCLYDLDLLDAGLLPGVLRHHPAAIINGELFRAPWGIGERPTGTGDALRLAEQLVAGTRDPEEITDLLAGVRRAVLEAESAARLARNLFDGTPIDPAGEATLRAFGVDLDAPARVVVMRPAVDQADLAARGIRLVASQPGEVAFVVDAATVDEPPIEELTRAGRTIGLGRVHTGAQGAARSYAEARRAADFADRLGLPVLRHEDLGLFSLLAEGGDTGAMADFVAEWLGPLLAHDERRSQKLLPTLAAYLDAGAAQQATADALGVHVSTLKYRLGRIEAVTGRDLSAPDVRFQLQVALAAQRTLSVLRNQEP